jgi:uncharacterized membrane protein YphA (DoxX/SURF4 family)
MDAISPIVSGARLALALIFLTSGVSKLWRFSAFRQAVANYDLGHAELVGVVARGVPLAELLIAACWISPFLLPATVASLMLLACFTTALGLVLRRGRRVPCGCFGLFDETPIGWNSLVRNAVLATLALLPSLLGKLVGAPLGRAQAVAVLDHLDSVLLTLATAAFLLVGVLLLDGVFTMKAKRDKIYPLLAGTGHERKAAP